ncbi:MAG: T9SS type A sorting domain-containing protein, partial [Ignavibacteria bacterium]|nr:T9SS type A sorting domain-containing protein [Ignavibacteria bacterium]
VGVQNASVTFINENDTTKKYNVITDIEGNYNIGIITSVNSDEYNIPSTFQLEQNYPNPFSSSTAIVYKLNRHADIQLRIYDVLGREVRKFNFDNQQAGIHGIHWDGKNNYGAKLSPGVYFYQLISGNNSTTRKMIFGTNRQNNLTLPNFVTSTLNESKLENKFVQSGNYKIRIENLPNTFPLIVSKQINNVPVNRDTTINISLDTEISIPVVTIYKDSTQQIIRGFGAANIVGWRPDMTTSQITKAFGTGDGQLGFSILRLRVPYSGTNQDFSQQVPTAKTAYQMGVTIIASPWTPPASMKTNNNIVGGRLKESSYAAYATHLNSFVNYMNNNGVPIYAVSVQNEPDVSVTYESCDWNAAEMTKFLKENGAAIDTKVMAPESFNFNKTISNSILNDSDVEKNVDIICGHLYGGGLEAYPLAASKGKELWMTEYLDLDTSWTANLGTGTQIQNCMNVGMNAYVWWYIVRYYGPIHETGYITKRGYVMSQFARFVRPGYYKIKSTPPIRNTNVTAYKGDASKVVVVATNITSSPIIYSFDISGSGINTFTPYTTTQTKNCVKGSDIQFINGKFTVILEPSSITTFVSN